MSYLDTNPSPYPGWQDTLAPLLMVVGLILFAIALAEPWCLRLRHTIAFSPHWLAWVDVFGLTLAVNLCSVYRRLSAKIAEGGTDRDFLGGIRLNIAVLVTLASMLLEVATRF